jgi:hypothetical protein
VEVFAGVADDAVHIDGFTDALKAKGDEDAYGDDNDMDGEVFEGVCRAFRAVNFHLGSLVWSSDRILRRSYSRMILTKTPSGRVAPPRMWMVPSLVKPRSMVSALA